MQLQNLKPYIPYAVVALVFAVLGAAGGWALKPDVVRVEERVRVQEVEKQVVVTKESVRVEVVRVKDQQLQERYRKQEVISSDGTVTRTEERNIDVAVHETNNKTEVKVVEVEKKVFVDRVVDRMIKVEPVLPNWNVGVLVGAAPRLDNLPSTPIMLGVVAERRLAGPVWAGLWAMGGSPVTQFQLTNVSAGIKLGVEF